MVKILATTSSAISSTSNTLTSKQNKQGTGLDGKPIKSPNNEDEPQNESTKDSTTLDGDISKLLKRFGPLKNPTSQSESSRFGDLVNDGLVVPTDTVSVAERNNLPSPSSLAFSLPGQSSGQPPSSSGFGSGGMGGPPAIPSASASASALASASASISASASPSISILSPSNSPINAISSSGAETANNPVAVDNPEHDANNTSKDDVI